MRAKLVAVAALLSGAAMLSGTNLAWADTAVTVTPPTTAPTKAPMEAATPQQSTVAGPTELTDGQMKKISAGHYWYQTPNMNWHWGNVDIYYGNAWHTFYAFHRG